MKTNFHVHNELCRHASGTIEDYANFAYKNGYEILGFADHGPIPNEPFKRMDIFEFHDIYLRDIKKAQFKYYNKMKIYAGIEIEYVYGYDDYYKSILPYLDYMILGTHYYSGKEGYNEKSSHSVDTKEKMEEYAQLISDALDTGFFKILAHPDLAMDQYPDYDSVCEFQFRKIIESVIRNDCFIEYNANGRKRGSRNFSYGEDFKYPNRKFWEIASEYKNLKVVIGADAHNPTELVDQALDDSEAYLESLGIKPYKTIF